MIRQVPCPGLQHTDHADPPTHKARVLGQLLGRRGASAEDQVVDGFLIPARNPPQPLRHGERQQKVGNRDLRQLLLPFQPPLCSLPLAFGTVPVLAGMVAVLLPLTVRAEIHMAAQHFRPAAFNIPHRPAVAGQHANSILLSVGRTAAAEDLRQLDHARLSITRLMVSAARSSPSRVRCV